MAQSERLPYQDHHWAVALPTRKPKHDEVRLLPSGVLEARDRVYEEVKSGSTPYRQIVMRTSAFYAPGYWLNVEREHGDRRGDRVY